MQAHALNLAAMPGQQRQVVGAAIQRAAIFGAVKAEFDDADPAGAEGEGGTADHDADRHAGDKAEIDDHQGDHQQGKIFQKQQTARRAHQPAQHQPPAGGEQQPAQREFGHSAQKGRIDHQHHGRQARQGEA